MLPTDLICGRLGQLFTPALCPEALVIDVPAEVVHGAMHNRTRSLPAAPVAPGPGMGSTLLDGVDSKTDASGLDGVPLLDLARVSVFQTWLRPVDIAYLIGPDGRLLSLDHGYYLTGCRWDMRLLEKPAVGDVVAVRSSLTTTPPCRSPAHRPRSRRRYPIAPPE